MWNYSREFFEKLKETSVKSAREIVPILMELVHPESVVDIGCGAGSWLSVFMEHGVNNVFGVDGGWVEKDMLQIPEDKFLSMDLKEPVRLNDQFDLVVSLEVAEHLPENSAESFVDSLAKLGQVVLFSAAIPFQIGEGHINMQWPEYWTRHFENKGFVVIDCIRKKVWNNDNVEFYYSQNMLLFARKEYLKTNSLLQRELENTNVSQLSLIHPKLYLYMASQK
jgi:cyclopropane fatty-acyl-phospholipid synthase-like methyltransferase